MIDAIVILIYLSPFIAGVVWMIVGVCKPEPPRVPKFPKPGTPPPPLTKHELRKLQG